MPCCRRVFNPIMYLTIKPTYEEKLRVSPGVSMGTDLYRLGIMIPFYNMLQMTSLEVQFGNPDNN